MTIKKKAHKRIEGRFIALPSLVYKSSAYRGLSSVARDVFMFVCSQYNERNNGDLTCTFKGVTESWGMKLSKSTYHRELKALIDSELLILTVQGGRHKASRYASAVWAIDDGGELEKAGKSPVARFLRQREIKSAGTVVKP